VVFAEGGVTFVFQLGVFGAQRGKVRVGHVSASSGVSCQPYLAEIRPVRSDGAVEKTRTSTGCPTATSTLRVYQFRHDRSHRRAGNSGERTERKERFAEISLSRVFPPHFMGRGTTKWWRGGSGRTKQPL